MTVREVVSKFVSYARHFKRIGRIDLMRHNLGLARAAKSAGLKTNSYY